jgi:hypothetical protein
MTTNRLNDAIALARAGNKQDARQVLIEVIRAEPTNEAAWLWLADTYTTEDERARILEQCIRTIPTSQMARKALSMLKSRDKTAPRPDQVSPGTRPPGSGSLSPPTSPILRYPKLDTSEPGPAVPTKPPVARVPSAQPETPAPEPAVEALQYEEPPPEQPQPEDQHAAESVGITLEEETPATEITEPEPVEPEKPLGASKRIEAPDMPFHVAEVFEPEEQAPATGGFQSFFATTINVPPPAPEALMPETLPPLEDEPVTETFGEPEPSVERIESEPTDEYEEAVQATEPTLAEETVSEELPAVEEQFTTPATISDEESAIPEEIPADAPVTGTVQPLEKQAAVQQHLLDEDDTEEFLRSFEPVQNITPAEQEDGAELLEPSAEQESELAWMEPTTPQAVESSFDWLEPPAVPAETPAPLEQPAEPSPVFGEGEEGGVSWLEDLHSVTGEKAVSRPPELQPESSPPESEISSKVDSWLSNIPEPKPWDGVPSKPVTPVHFNLIRPSESKPVPTLKPVEKPIPPVEIKSDHEIKLAADHTLIEQLRKEKPAAIPAPKPPKTSDTDGTDEVEKAAGTDWLTIALIAAFVLVVILAVGFYLVWSRIRDQNSALSTLIASTQYAIETHIAAPSDTPVPPATPTFSPTPLTPTMTFTPSTPTITFTPTSTPEDPLAISPKNATSFMPVSAINTGSGELAISPELNFIAFWNPEDRKKAMKVDLWDLVSGNLIVILTGHEKNISAAAFSPNGRLLATGDEGGTMRLWDVPAGTELFVMVVNKTRVNDLEFSPGGRFLASVTSDNTIRLWNTTNGELLYALNFLEGQAEDSPVPLNVAFSPNGRMLAAGTNGAIAIWSTSDGSLLKTLGEGVTGWNVSFSPDSQLIAEAGDGYVGLWNTATGMAERSFPGAKNNEGVPPNYAFSPDGSKLVIEGSVDTPQLALWDLSMGIQLKAFDGGWSDTITGLFSPDGRVLAGFGHTADQKFIALLWDIASGSKLTSYEDGFDFRFSPDGHRLLVRSGMIQMWTVPTANVPATPTPTP